MREDAIQQEDGPGERQRQTLYMKVVIGAECVDEFLVIKGTGGPLLGRKTAEKLNVLCIRPDMLVLYLSHSERGVRPGHSGEMYRHTPSRGCRER